MSLGSRSFEWWLPTLISPAETLPSPGTRSLIPAQGWDRFQIQVSHQPLASSLPQNVTLTWRHTILPSLTRSLHCPLSLHLWRAELRGFKLWDDPCFICTA